MDSSLNIKSNAAPARARALRDPVPVRAAGETELAGDRAVAAVGDGGKERGAKDQGAAGGHPDRRADHAPQELVVNPDSRDVIYRERDVRASEREHPDQALLRQRAYHRLPPAAPEPAAANDPHADIKA